MGQKWGGSWVQYYVNWVFFSNLKFIFLKKVSIIISWKNQLSFLVAKKFINYFLSKFSNQTILRKKSKHYLSKINQKHFDENCFWKKPKEKFEKLGS